MKEKIMKTKIYADKYSIVVCKIYQVDNKVRKNIPERTSVLQESRNRFQLVNK